jgi:hypothetical protein
VAIVRAAEVEGVGVFELRGVAVGGGEHPDDKLG